MWRARLRWTTRPSARSPARGGASAFTLHILPIPLYTYERALSASDIRVEAISSTIAVEGQPTTLMVRKSRLVDDATGKQMLCVNQRLSAVIGEDGSLVPFDGQSTSWKVNRLNVQLMQPAPAGSLTLVFRNVYGLIGKDEFDTGFDDPKYFHPNLYLIRDGVELSSSYIYVHKDLSSYVYFEDEPDPGAEYTVRMVDFQRIYKFSQNVMNRFDKALTVSLGSFQTRDGIGDSLSNLSISVSREAPGGGAGQLVSSVYLNARYLSNGYWYDTLTGSIPYPSASALFNEVLEDWPHRLTASTIYRKNGFVTPVSVFDVEARTDRALSSVSVCSGVSPFAHYYGWVTDSLGNVMFGTPGVLNDVPSAWLDGHMPTSGEYQQDSQSVGQMVRYVEYDSGNGQLVSGSPLLDVTKVTSPYLVLKRNDTPVHVRLVNADPGLSSDLRYDSWDRPVYMISAISEWSGRPVCTRYDAEKASNGYYYEYMNETSAVWLGAYERSASFHEFSGGYDFFFADYAEGGNEKVYPGDYWVSVLQGDEEVSANVALKQLTPAAEEAGEAHRQTLEWPNVNINGKVVNTFGGAVHRDGATVRLTDTGTGKAYEFRYRCAFPLEEGLNGLAAYSPSSYHNVTQYSEDAKADLTLQFYNDYGSWRRRYWCNAWDEHFRFMYSGAECQCMFWLENGPYYSYDGWYSRWHESGDDGATQVVTHNCDSLRASPAVPEGRYRLDLLSPDGSLVSTYFESLDVSKANQEALYGLTLELPYCTVSGTVRTEDGELCYGNDWKVRMDCLGEPANSREMTLWSRDPASDNMVSRFAFAELGTLRDCAGSGKVHTLGAGDAPGPLTDKLGVTTSGYLKGYCEPGLMPGEYTLSVEYRRHRGLHVARADHRQQGGGEGREAQP